MRLFLLPIWLVWLWLLATALPASGQPVACGDSRGSGITIVVFLAVDCPISQKYIPVLNGIAEKYQEQGVSFQALIPGNVTDEDREKFSKEYNIAFPVRADSDHQCTQALLAEVTPEVFVFDKNKKLQYRGAIDNWFYELGGYRKQSTEHYLIDAIDALRAGRDPAVGRTKSVGCVLSYREKKLHGNH